MKVSTLEELHNLTIKDFANWPQLWKWKTAWIKMNGRKFWDYVVSSMCEIFCFVNNNIKDCCKICYCMHYLRGNRLQLRKVLSPVFVDWWCWNCTLVDSHLPIELSALLLSTLCVRSSNRGNRQSDLNAGAGCARLMRYALACSRSLARLALSESPNPHDLSRSSNALLAQYVRRARSFTRVVEKQGFLGSLWWLQAALQRNVRANTAMLYLRLKIRSTWAINLAIAIS